MLDYPKRGPYFAHKTFRLMHKSMIAAELGRDVLCLLAVILHTEDAARYRGPVSYFNSQLIETLGFKKWEQFDAARKKAIEAGWLQYEGCGKRSAGRYFVTIPAGYEQIDDGLMEECISPENGYKQGYDAGYKAGYDEGIKRGTIQGQCGVRSGDKQGEPPISLSLPLNPTPNPKEEPPLSPKGERFDATKIELPEKLRTEHHRQAWEDFVKHRSAIKKPIKETSVSGMLSMLERMPPDVAYASLVRTTANQWQGIRECPRDEMHLFRPPPKPGEIDF
jgi:hypothetical protein